MHELQPPGAVYQHQGKAQYSPSVGAQQASEHLRANGKASARVRAHKGKEKADSKASGRGREAGGSSAAKSTACRRRRGRLCMQSESACLATAQCALMLLTASAPASEPALSTAYHGTGHNAQSNGERQCWSHLPGRQTRRRGLRKRHRRLPPCAILERSRTLEPQHCIDRHASSPNSISISRPPGSATNHVLAHPASAGGCVHPIRPITRHSLPHPAPAPSAFPTLPPPSISFRSVRTTPQP